MKVTTHTVGNLGSNTTAKESESAALYTGSSGGAEWVKSHDFDYETINSAPKKNCGNKLQIEMITYILFLQYMRGK